MCAASSHITIVKHGCWIIKRKPRTGKRGMEREMLEHIRRHRKRTVYTRLVTKVDTLVAVDWKKGRRQMDKEAELEWIQNDLKRSSGWSSDRWDRDVAGVNWKREEQNLFNWKQFGIACILNSSHKIWWDYILPSDSVQMLLIFFWGGEINLRTRSSFP